MTVKLNDLQRILLTRASQREDRRLDLVDVTDLDAAKVKAARNTLVRKHLFKERAVAGHDTGESMPPWYVLTDAGLEAIGAVDAEGAAVLNDTAVKVSAPAIPAKVGRGPTKRGIVLALLRRPEGATLDQMVGATDWLPHTMRAMLTGLKKKGHVITREATADASIYRVTSGQ